MLSSVDYAKWISMVWAVDFCPSSEHPILCANIPFRRRSRMDAILDCYCIASQTAPLLSHRLSQSSRTQFANRDDDDAEWCPRRMCRRLSPAVQEKPKNTETNFSYVVCIECWNAYGVYSTHRISAEHQRCHATAFVCRHPRRQHRIDGGEDATLHQTHQQTHNNQTVSTGRSNHRRYGHRN